MNGRSLTASMVIRREGRFAPYSYAVYLDEQLPQSRLHGYPGQGHLFLLRLFEEVFAQVSR